MATRMALSPHRALKRKARVFRSMADLEGKLSQVLALPGVPCHEHSRLSQNQTGRAPKRPLQFRPPPACHRAPEKVCPMRLLLTLCLAYGLYACSDSTTTQGCASDSDCPDGTSCVFQGEALDVPNACVPDPEPAGNTGGADATSGADVEESTASDTESVDVAPPCVPQCGSNNCGDNGCGGLCGTCFGNYTCEEGVCTPCQPDCEGKTCGDDGCGEACGTCAEGEVCTASQCGPPPPAICMEMAPCLMAACADSDDAAACIATATETCGPAETPAQEAAAVDLVTCMANNGCSLAKDAGGAECQRGFCLPETVTCSQSTEGVEECHTILECIESDACPKDFMTGEITIGCLAGCIENVSAEAASKYWTLMLCVDAECLGDESYTDPEVCFQDKTKNGGPCGWPLRDCLVTALN